MGEVFGPDDQAAFEAARDRLVAEFVRSGGFEFDRVAEQLLDLKWSYLGGDIERWSLEDVEEILFGLYPAKVMLDPSDIAEVPAGFAAYLRYLASVSARQEPPLDVLAEFVERSTSRFIAAMSDESNWSFGKRMWSTALGDGVDLSDQAAVGQWIESFNQRPRSERDHILGQLPSAAGTVGRAVIGAMPPVVLADDDELTAMAADAILVKRLVALVEFVGAGRPLTDRGNLKLADGKALVGILGTGDRLDGASGLSHYKVMSSEDLNDVDFTFCVALATKLLDIDGRKVRPGDNARWTNEAPLDLAYGALLVVLHVVGPTQHRYRKNRYNFGWFAEDLDAHLPLILMDLYRHRAPVEIDELIDEVWADLEGGYDLSKLSPENRKMERGSVAFSMRHAFDRLVEAGVVVLADETITPNRYSGNDRTGGTIGLSPLGLWALQRMASRITDAPIVGTLRSATAGELLRAASDLSEDVARAEIDAWIDTHPNTASAELCNAIRNNDETGRGLAFRALLRIGPAAAAAVATLIDDPDLAAFVTVWRVDTLAAGPDEMDRSTDPDGWVRLLHTVIELWGPQAAVAVWADTAAGVPGLNTMLTNAWRVKGPHTADVLAAIGAHHHDKNISKAARKALFKHHSAG